MFPDNLLLIEVVTDKNLGEKEVILIQVECYQQVIILVREIIQLIGEKGILGRL
jgi:hypothetical protein